MHILVIRLSAMGDVAMAAPVIIEALNQNSSLEVTVLSKKPFQHFFPESNRLHFECFDTKGEHKGLSGIYKKFKQLHTKAKFTAVADFHNVLRSRVLSGMFKTAGVSVQTIDKGRKEKKDLTRKENKVLKPLEHTSERYAAVLRACGVSFDFSHEARKPYLKKEPPVLALNKWNVGIAPFAQHQGKAYSFEKVKTVIVELKKNASINLFLFGGGPTETELLQNLEGENVFSMAGKFSLNEELAQISNLDLMLSMDSANMHMASLFGVRTISIWGATHYFAGFMGIGQSQEDAIEITTEKLECRPCSVFGNKTCYRKDYACLNWIKSEDVFYKINDTLKA